MIQQTTNNKNDQNQQLSQQHTPIVYIYNLFQDIHDTFITLPFQQRVKMQEDHTTSYNQYQMLSILSQFPQRSSYYIIVLSQISQVYIQYACKNLLQIQRQKVNILVPNKNNKIGLGSICQYIMQDQQLMKKLNQIGKFDLLSTTITDYFLDFCQKFKDVANPLEYVSKENWSKIKKYGTKSGIRQLVANIKNEVLLPMPKGKVYLCSQHSYEDAVREIIGTLKNQGIVAKTEKASSGYGVVIFKKQQVANLSQQKIKQYVQSKLIQPFWKKRDIVTEQLIDVDYSIGIPCLQIRVDKSGKIEIVSIFTMCVANEHQLDGLQFGTQINKDHVARMKQTSILLSQQYHKMGYQGFLNLDFLIDKKGDIYFIQSNVRRSGALFIHNIAKLILKEQYPNKFLKFQYYYEQKLKKTDFNNLVKQLKQRGFHFNKEKKEGIILMIQACFKIGYMQFLTVTKTKQEGIQLGQQLKLLFK